MVPGFKRNLLVVKFVNAKIKTDESDKIFIGCGAGGDEHRRL